MQTQNKKYVLKRAEQTKPKISKQTTWKTTKQKQNNYIKYKTKHKIIINTKKIHKPKIVKEIIFYNKLKFALYVY